MTSRIPAAPLLLGLAGLIPPVTLTALALFAGGDFGPSMPGFVRTYAAIILSFLGGTWWAFACREERPSWLLLLAAVSASLAGWAAIFWFFPPEALFALAALMVAALGVDVALVARRLAPRWWLKLRVPLSLVLASCCALSGWALIR